MSDLFKGPSGDDPLFNAVMAADNDNARIAREFVDKLWPEAEPYLDSDFKEQIRKSFHTRFWEMYLAASLKRDGKDLVPRAQRVHGSEGPDLTLAGPQWIEAVAVAPGEGPDRVVRPEDHKCVEVPDAEVRLRILNGISEKRSKYYKYRDKALVGVDDPCVIAVNAALVPWANAEREIPRIVRCLLPFGWERILISLKTGEVVERSHEYENEVQKASGSPVGTALFEGSAAADVSAVLYSTVDAFNPPKCWLGGLTLVHNPNAKNPLPLGWISAGAEYWVEGNSLKGCIR